MTLATMNNTDWPLTRAKAASQDKFSWTQRPPLGIGINYFPCVVTHWPLPSAKVVLQDNFSWTRRPPLINYPPHIVTHWPLTRAKPASVDKFSWTQRPPLLNYFPCVVTHWPLPILEREWRLALPKTPVVMNGIFVFCDATTYRIRGYVVVERNYIDDQDIRVGEITVEVARQPSLDVDLYVNPVTKVMSFDPL